MCYIINSPENGILNVPKFIIDNEGVKRKVVAWEARHPEQLPNVRVEKIVFPSTLRDIGPSPQGYWKKGILDALCRIGLKSVEVDSANPFLRSEDGILMSKDGKEIFFISYDRMSESVLKIPEGVEIIHVPHENDKSWDNYPKYPARDCVVLPKSLKAANHFFEGYRYIVNLSNTPLLTAEEYMHGSKRNNSYSYFEDYGFCSRVEVNFKKPDLYNRDDLTNRIMIPIGSLDAHRNSHVWETASGRGKLKEMEFEGKKKVSVNMNFETDRFLNGFINGVPIENKDYIFDPLTPVEIEFEVRKGNDAWLDYFRDSTEVFPVLIYQESDDKLHFIYRFMPSCDTRIEFGCRKKYYATSGDLTFKVEKIEDGIKILSLDGDLPSTTLILPDYLEVEGEILPITAIGAEAFERRSIKTVQLPKHLKSIGAFAFHDTGLTEISLPETIEDIDWAAFALGNNGSGKSHRIGELKLPTSLRNLGELVFNGYEIEKITIPSGLLNNVGGDRSSCVVTQEKISEMVVEPSIEPLLIGDIRLGKLISNREIKFIETKKSHIEEIEINNTNINIPFSAIETFGKDGLRKLKLTGNTITLKDQVVDEDRFLYYLSDKSLPLETISIDCDHLKLNGSCFSNARFKKVNIQADEAEMPHAAFLNCSQLEELNVSGLKRLNQEFLSNCSSLKNFKIPAETEVISSTAFEGCTGLKKLEIENNSNPIFIASCAFNDNELEHVVLGRTIHEVEPSFFRSPKLKRLDISANVEYLSDYAFADCTDLREIYCESEIPAVIGPNTFRNVSTDECKIYVKGSDGEYREAGGWKEFFPISGIKEAQSEQAKIYSEGNELVIIGAEGCRVDIYSLSGVRMHHSDCATMEERISLPGGVYAVTLPGKTMKIIHSAGKNL